MLGQIRNDCYFDTEVGNHFLQAQICVLITPTFVSLIILKNTSAVYPRM
jgi:hypothetical protein